MANKPYPACALPEGSRYYLLRGNVMVPLVPVDQLPFTLQLVPRQLTHPQMSHGGWKFCSETNEAPTMLSVQEPSGPLLSSIEKPRFLAPDHHIRAEPQGAPKKHAQQGPWSQHLLPVERAPELPRSALAPTPERPTSLTDTIASVYPRDAQRLGYQTPYPSGVQPDPSKKVYCTHWIKTGECDFTATGCKYKHEMPSTEKLRELGFRNMPMWWKEKSAIAPRLPTSLQRHLAGGGNAVQPSGMPTPRAFDPSTWRNNQAGNLHILSAVTQQPRGMPRRSVDVEQSTAARPNPPPAPAHTSVRGSSNVPEMLIDLDDVPAPPPSPQLSKSSSTSASSSDTQASASHGLVSPPPSQSVEFSSLSPIECRPTSIVDGGATAVVDSKPTANTIPSAVLEKTAEAEDSSIRRRSSISCPSDTEEDTVPKLPKPVQKRKRTRGRPARYSTILSKQQTGLAASKHADQSKDTEDRSKNVDNCTRDANRRVKANDVGAPQLQDQTERLHRDSQKAKK